MMLTLPDKVLAISAEAMPLATLTSAMASVLTPLMKLKLPLIEKEGNSLSWVASVPSTVSRNVLGARPFSRTAPLETCTPLARLSRLVQSRREMGSS